MENVYIDYSKSIPKKLKLLLQYQLSYDTLCHWHSLTAEKLLNKKLEKQRIQSKNRANKVIQ